MLARLFPRSVSTQNTTASYLNNLPADVGALSYHYIPIDVFSGLQSSLPFPHKHEEIYQSKCQHYFPKRYAAFLSDYNRLCAKHRKREADPKPKPVLGLKNYWQTIFWNLFKKTYDQDNARTRQLLHLAIERRIEELSKIIKIEDLENLKDTKNAALILFRLIQAGRKDEERLPIPVRTQLYAKQLGWQNLLNTLFLTKSKKLKSANRFLGFQRETSDENMSLLYWAILCNQEFHIVSLFIQKVTSENQAFLINIAGLAALLGCVNGLMALLSLENSRDLIKTHNTSKSLLCFAASENQIDVITLLDSNIAPYPPEVIMAALKQACLGGHLDTIKYLQKNYHVDLDLVADDIVREAVKSNNVVALTTLIAEKPNFDFGRVTCQPDYAWRRFYNLPTVNPVWEAARLRQTDIIIFFLKQPSVKPLFTKGYDIHCTYEDSNEHFTLMRKVATNITPYKIAVFSHPYDKRREGPHSILDSFVTFGLEYLDLSLTYSYGWGPPLSKIFKRYPKKINEYSDSNGGFRRQSTAFYERCLSSGPTDEYKEDVDNLLKQGAQINALAYSYTNTITPNAEMSTVVCIGTILHAMPLDSIIRKLLAHGADVTIKDYRGRTPADIATERKIPIRFELMLCEFLQTQKHWPSFSASALSFFTAPSSVESEIKAAVALFNILFLEADHAVLQPHLAMLSTWNPLKTPLQQIYTGLKPRLDQLARSKSLTESPLTAEMAASVTVVPHATLYPPTNTSNLVANTPEPNQPERKLS
jgi:hypothetical protein